MIFGNGWNPTCTVHTLKTATKLNIQIISNDKTSGAHLQVGWDEFLTMYQRCISDSTGNEPRNLFNLIQFLMYDKDTIVVLMSANPLCVRCCVMLVRHCACMLGPAVG